MRLCLLPLRVLPRQPALNLGYLQVRLQEVSSYRPDLVLLPESALTGYLYEAEDLQRFAEPIPGPLTQQVAALAQKHSFWLCFGLLERASAGFYDSALLLDRRGHIVLHHRKIHEYPPFLCGDRADAVDTELGRLGLLICGDLFSEQALRSLDKRLDLLLVPMWRSFDGRSPDSSRWDGEERQAYMNQVRQVGFATALVNGLEVADEDAAFGGAMMVGAQGNLLIEAPHGTDQAIFWET